MSTVVRRRCDGCDRDIGVRQATGQLAPHFPCSASRPPGVRTKPPYERVMEKCRRVRGGHLLYSGYVHLPTGCPMIKTGPRVTPDTGMRAKNESCRRIVWEHHHGPMPKHTQIRSTCGRATCLALEHMTVELPRDHEADAAARRAASEARAAVVALYERLAADYKAGVLTVAQIAALHDVARMTVIRAARRAGVPRRPSGWRPPRA